MYRCGDRYQMELFPKSIEEYVDQDDPVRAYDAFVEALDFNELGIALNQNKVGSPEYNPKTMLKLLVFGYSYGFRSSRKLERALYHNISFIWLASGLKPDHKTIAEFRRNNIRALKNVLRQCARLCIKLDLIAGNTLFVDSTKIRANASIKNTWTKDKCEDALKKADKRIDSILSECEETDNKEQDEPSLIKLKEDLRDTRTLKSKIQGILKELKDTKEKSINTTDPECGRMKSLQGSHAGYNAQIAVDEKRGLIVNSDVVSENNDIKQFAEQVDQANETLGRKCDTACADSGYADTQELEKIDRQDIRVIVPPQKQDSKKELFKYDFKNDCYICPQGHKLLYSYFCKRRKLNIYIITDKNICLRCRYFGICTKDVKGGKIARLLNEEVKEKLEARYKQPESQEIYRLRQQRAEHPFGHIKRNLSATSFLLRSRDGAKAEFSLLTSCFNLSRMMTILGVQGLIQAIRG